MAKRCGRCKELKDAELFHKNRGHADGLTTICKKCRNDQFESRYTRSGQYIGEYYIKKATLSKIGQRYHKLLVTAIVGVQRYVVGKKQSQRVIARCLCDCGQTRDLLLSAVLRGHTKSCGCSRFGENEIVLGTKKLIRNYKQGAKNRGLPFNLTMEQVLGCVHRNCHYCGREPQQTIRVNAQYSFTYNGLDRRDNARGYEPDNVLPCCKICNRAKHNMAYEEFLAYLNRIKNHALAACDPPPFNRVEQTLIEYLQEELEDRHG